MNQKILNIIKEVQAKSDYIWHQLAYNKDFCKVYMNIDIFRLKLQYKLDRLSLCNISSLRKLVADHQSLINFDTQLFD